ncbi:MAG TPA: thioesterase family protein [Stellaceae bacterium]|nr:thioesterase family protein [Stellaceae bacterium]
MSFPAPFERHAEAIQPGWIDYNGHMNVAYYVLVFDHGTDALCDALDLGAGYVARTDRSLFIAEAHITYEREVRLGDTVRIVSRVLGADHKRIHLFHEMFHAEGGWRAASTELMALHVDLTLRRTAPFDDAQRDLLAAVVASHRALPLPAGIGRRINM